MIWRPILAKVTTLQEIESHWSIDDLADAHEALDIQFEMEQFESDRITEKLKRKK